VAVVHRSAARLLHLDPPHLGLAPGIVYRVTRVAWLNGLRRLAEFEFGLAGVDGVACGVA
jgi:ABC-type branched-subunit amino acid transport system ATPase component